MKPDSSLNLITLTMKQNDVDSVDGRFCKSAQNIKTSVDVDDCCVEPMARHRSPKNQREAFTKAFFDECKTRAIQTGRTIEASDTKCTGLKAIFHSSGRIKFIVRKSIRGKNVYVSVGSYPEFSINNAREHAFKIIQELKASIETYGERFLTHSKMTFNELVDEYEKSV
ncbi:DUF4102 domain-containing protein, partial [Escherichia coli]|nr:DUF4102 domain-containing protein [Escherichia coli]